MNVSKWKLYGAGLLAMGVLVLCAGCKRSVPSGISDAPDLSEIDSPVVSPAARAALGRMEGKWFYSKQMSDEALRAKAKTEEEKRDVEKYLGMMAAMEKEAGAPFNYNVEIAGTRITGFGGMMEPQFDITEAHMDGEKVKAKAWYHEDRHDPGDMSKIDLGFLMRDDVLQREIYLGGKTYTDFFTRQK